MDGQRFDRLTRRLVGHASRRAVVRSLLGCAGGGFLSATILRRAGAASCGGFCSALPPGRQRGDCAKECAQDAPGGLFAECDGDATRLCQAPGGAFVCCATGETCCNGACADTSVDEANCGGCGIACPPPPSGAGVAVCISSDCGMACAAGHTACAGDCVDVLADEAHCGGCDQACAPGLTCCAGACVLIQADPAHCGACGTACDEDETCCSGVCVDILTDPDHCSGCDEACAEEHACCGGVCIGTQSDEANCGACGTTCHPHATCFDGACRCCQGGSVSCGSFSTDEICCDFPLTAVQCCNASCDDPQLDCVMFCLDCGLNFECDFGAACPPGYGSPWQEGAGGPVPSACVG